MPSTAPTPAPALPMPLPLKLPGAFLELAAAMVDGQAATGKAISTTRPYNWQAIRALAYLFCQPTYQRNIDRYAAEIRDLFAHIRDAAEPPDNRLTGHLAEAYVLLKQAGALDLMPGVEEQLLRGAKKLCEHLEKYRDLTHFTSASLGTGTNHVAVYAASVYRVGELLGRPDDCTLARETARRLALDQFADGYWPETTGGPSVLYNHLTATCMARLARFTGDELFRTVAQRGAEFQQRASYPDGCDVETIDGRCRYHPMPMLWGGFIHAHTPAGRAYVQRRLETFVMRNHHADFHTHGGEYAALLCEDHAFWPAPAAPASATTATTAAPTAQPPAALDVIRSDTALSIVRRASPWCFTLNGIHHLPREGGGFTIDRISLFSLWHASRGLIVNGSGEPGATAAQSFRFRDTDQPVYGIPELVQIDPAPEADAARASKAGAAAAADLHAEYRGGTAHLAVRTLNERDCELTVAAATRADRYPVRFTIQLELRAGDRVNGRTLALGNAGACDLTAAGLAGRITTDRWQLTFPPDAAATLHWPYDPYNPYDVEKHHSAPEDYVTLLHFDLTRAPLTLRFQVT